MSYVIRYHKRDDTEWSPMIVELECIQDASHWVRLRHGQYGARIESRTKFSTPDFVYELCGFDFVDLIEDFDEESPKCGNYWYIWSDGIRFSTKPLSPQPVQRKTRWIALHITPDDVRAQALHDFLEQHFHHTEEYLFGLMVGTTDGTSTKSYKIQVCVPHTSGLPAEVANATTIFLNGWDAAAMQE